MAGRPEKWRPSSSSRSNEDDLSNIFMLGQVLGGKRPMDLKANPNYNPSDVNSSPYILGKRTWANRNAEDPSVALNNELKYNRWLMEQDRINKAADRDAEFQNRLTAAAEEDRAARERWKLEAEDRRALAREAADRADRLASQQFGDTLAAQEHKIKQDLIAKQGAVDIDSKAADAALKKQLDRMAAALAYRQRIPLGDALAEVQAQAAEFGPELFKFGYKGAKQNFRKGNADIGKVRADTRFTDEQTRNLADLNDRYVGKPRLDPLGKLLYPPNNDNPRILTRKPVVGKEILNDPKTGAPVSSKDVRIGEIETFESIEPTEEERARRFMAKVAEEIAKQEAARQEAKAKSQAIIDAKNRELEEKRKNYVKRPITEAPATNKTQSINRQYSPFYYGLHY